MTTYLITVRQADTFLRGRGTRLEAATRADLKALMADLLARRTARTAAYHKVLKILYGWLARNRRFRPTRSCPPTPHPQGRTSLCPRGGLEPRPPASHAGALSPEL